MTFNLKWKPLARMTETVVVFVCCLLSGMMCSAVQVSVAPIPDGEAVSEDYTLSVNGLAVPVYSCRVSAVPLNQIWPGYQRPLDQTELAGFACWEMDGAVQVTVDSKSTVESVVIRPQSLGIRPVIEGNRISFTLEKPGPVVVEINGLNHALHLFPGTVRPKTDKEKEGRYFGPGVHDVGILELKSGDSLYIDAGAVVYGSIRVKNAENITIEGRGIIDSSKLDRSEGGGCLSFNGCKNIQVSGLVLRDPNVWTVNVFNCDDVTISNVYLIGLWRYNADGIDVCNSRNVVVQDSFVRSFDDSLVVKGLVSFNDQPVENLLFQRCVLWCDWGRAMELGAETCTPKMENVRFVDCDIIRTTHIAMDIQHGDRARISNIRFDNIRVEIDDWNLMPIYQNKDDMQYVIDKNWKYCPTLMVLVILKSFYSQNEERGTIDNVVFKDIHVIGNRNALSSFTGYDAEHSIRNVRIENLRFNDENPVSSAQELGLKTNEFVTDIQIIP